MNAEQHGHPKHTKDHHGVDLAVANCKVLPDIGHSDVKIEGNITIYQDKNGTGILYFDVELQGFDGPGLHAIHVHSNAVQGGDCSTTGSHFDLNEGVHGDPTSNIRHLGDLGNLKVSSDGTIKDYLIGDLGMSLHKTENGIISRSINIHAGADDFGMGGTPASTSSGNAGPRIACCTIYMQAVPIFRFNG